MTAGTKGRERFGLIDDKPKHIDRPRPYDQEVAELREEMVTHAAGRGAEALHRNAIEEEGYSCRGEKRAPRRSGLIGVSASLAYRWERPADDPTPYRSQLEAWVAESPTYRPRNYESLVAMANRIGRKLLLDAQLLAVDGGLREGDGRLPLTTPRR